MPRQAMTVAEKQQRALLRRMAKQKGRVLAQQQATIKSNAEREMHQFRSVLDEQEHHRTSDGSIGRVGGMDIRTYRAFNLAEAIRSVTSVVRASFGIDQQIEYDYSQAGIDAPRIYARTNLKSILLSINLADFIPTNEDAIKKSIALLKGATYHEVAHCLWTNDWSTVGDDYTFPEGTEWVEYFRAWNLLEDGRIETLLVSKSPIIRNYLLPMIYEVVLDGKASTDKVLVNAMPFLVVRSYLPSGLRRSALRHTREAGADLSILSDMYDLSRQYQAGTTWDEHLPIVLKFHELLTKWEETYPIGEPGGQHPGRIQAIGDHGNSKFSSKGGIPVPVIVPNENDWKKEDFDQSNGPSKIAPKSEEGEGNSESSGDASDKDSTDKESSPVQSTKDGASQHGNTGVSTGEAKPQTSSSLVEDLYQEFKDSIKDAVSDSEFNEVTKQYNASMKRNLPKVLLDGDSRFVPDSSVIQANTLAVGMINALDTLCVTPDPSWTYRQSDGPLLDVESFTTREPGDDRFWVDRDGTGERGHDLAVSVLLDCSGSMETELLNLGVVAYAIRKACGFFDIPCTTTLFGSSSYTLWDANDEPEVLVLPNLGGTSVGASLLDIPNQRYDKSRHLVVILTDGSWGDVNSIRPFLQNDEVSLIVGLNVSPWGLQRGADAIASIKDLIDLPSEVEKQIARFFV